MGRLKKLIQDDPVHERNIDIKTYPVGDERVIVEGWLKDDRLTPGYNWDGTPRGRGTVHWLCARLLVGGWPPAILDAEAEMRKVPHELCPTTLDAVEKIVGLSITSGYSQKVRERLGGIESCSHLMHLIVTMGPAILHGYWTERSRRPLPMPRSMEDIPGLQALINSCKLWREDGPIHQHIKETLEKLGEK